MSSQNLIKALVGLAVALLIISGFLIYAIFTSQNIAPGNVNSAVNTNQPVLSTGKDLQLAMKKFSSAQDFKDYLKSASGLLSSGYGYGMGTMVKSAPGVALDSGQSFGTAAGLGEVAAAPERVSETNVQVSGVDEPDILKTDGKQIYYSQTQRYYYAPVRMQLEDSVAPRPDAMIAPPQRNTAQTLTLKAFPPAELAKIGGIDQVGNLLLAGNRLAIFTNDNKIYGYDISDPAKPKESWVVKFENNTYLLQSRLADGQIYLVTRRGISEFDPCPFKVLSVGEAELNVGCTDIYHPSQPVGVDVTYTVSVLDPASGKIGKTASFIGASDSSVVYMSKENIYLTYAFNPDPVAFMYDFFVTKASDLVTPELIEKLRKLNGYDISRNAKMTEFQVIMQNFDASLSADDRLKLENEITNRMTDYLLAHRRELEQTGVVKVNIDKFAVTAAGQVPGRPLNQFSLDEFNGDLRIAVTIGSNMGFGATESVSDVYVLGEDLKVLSAVTDLGRGERIYAARFLEDKGYVVTFRQTDPFYVIDLSNPKKAELKGELKIPGFSSYLHPISKDRILGIGREQSKVKISLFDVSNPAAPAEVAKYMLEEYWTEVQNTHHAFLLDSKHGVFFMPGSKGGYVFAYQNDQLKLQTAVSDTQVKRALYLDDYLYIVGEESISVLDENNWQKVKELAF